jgi:2-iminoacetate synthase ThiH
MRSNLIREAGRTPAERDTLYGEVQWPVDPAHPALVADEDA